MKQVIISASWKMSWNKKHPVKATKWKWLKKNEASLLELQDNMTCNNMHIIVIPEGEQKQQGKEIFLKK